MWKPEPDTTYRNTESGMTINVKEVPNTIGKPTFVVENLNVKSVVGGLQTTLPVIWFHKRRKILEKVE